MSKRIFDNIFNILNTQNSTGTTNGALYVAGGINIGDNLISSTIASTSCNVTNYINNTQGSKTISNTLPTSLLTGLTIGNIGNIIGYQYARPLNNFNIQYFMSNTGGGICKTIFTNTENWVGSIDTTGNFLIQRTANTGNNTIRWAHIRYN